MATYLELHPGPIAQWRTVRRNGATPTGTTVIHTYECPHTWSLEQGARGIAQRSDRPASYHCLAGDGSGTDVLQMAPWSAETWHETSTNNWAAGISMLTYAGAWNTIPRASADNLVRSAAYAAYLYATWLKANRGITIPARRITRAQALARQPGFIGHGEIDVGRRTDPGAGFDWALFLTEYARLMGGIAAPIRRPFMRVIHNPEQAERWITDGVTKRWVQKSSELPDLLRLCDQAESLMLGRYVTDRIPTYTAAGAVDVAALAAAIVKALPAVSGGLTAAAVTAAVKAGLATLTLRATV